VGGRAYKEDKDKGWGRHRPSELNGSWEFVAQAAGEVVGSIRACLPCVMCDRIMRRTRCTPPLCTHSYRISPCWSGPLRVGGATLRTSYTLSRPVPLILVPCHVLCPTDTVLYHTLQSYRLINVPFSVPGVNVSDSVIIACGSVFHSCFILSIAPSYRLDVQIPYSIPLTRQRGNCTANPSSRRPPRASTLTSRPLFLPQPSSRPPSRARHSSNRTSSTSLCFPFSFQFCVSSL
jgi:hypothetical protein